MYNRGSSPILTSCSFTGNNAYSSSGNSEFSQGSGMYNSETSSPILTNCTFVANQAFSDGGAIYNYSSSSPILSNCIVWGSGRNPVYDASSTSTVMYSDIQGGYNGIGNSNVEPQFVRSPWVGQDGYFATADDDYGDLRLRIGSGCLDAGSNAAVPANATDIAGNTRIQNQTVDLGAYEGAFAAPASKLIYVDQRSNGANTGASWADAYTSLQSAILAASDGDVIRVADGTYMPTDGTDRMIRFSLRSGVNLYGGYAGYGAPFPDARDIEANATLLSGDIGTVGTVADNSYHVVTATQFAAPAVIDGLSITLGYANEALDRGHGGGFLAIGILSVTLNNCTFIANTASYGGGMYNSYSSPVLTNCTFRLNEGVGMYNSNSSPTLTDCSFSGNTGTYGGMCNDNSSPMLDNCSFSGNIAESCGGAMSNVHSSSPTLTECTFNGNSAALYGGGIYNYSCSPTLTNCIFSGNAATSNGGGMYNSSASPALTNCIFSGNSASSYGGGIYNSSSAPTLINCTLNGNTATSRGGALANESTSSPTLTNCIVWSNGSGGIYNSSSTPIITYCDIQGGYSGNGNMNVDPRFIASPGDLRLQVTSPCIDAGSNSAVPAGVITDAAGNSRIVDYPAVHDPGAIVDMGAYERPASLTATGGGVIADGPQPGVRFDMSSQLDVASIALGDVLIRTVLGDGSLGPTVNATGFSYDSTTRGIRFNLPVSIVDGNYRASLLIGSVSDTYGNALAAECSQDFFILGGDANRDRVVDINDLAILAMNWQGSGKVFSQGDFNYDGKVDAKDLGILSTHWQQALPPPAAAAPVSVVRAPTRTATRVIALVAPSL
jgi:parallel beta-helix repeat protein